MLGLSSLEYRRLIADVVQVYIIVHDIDHVDILSSCLHWLDIRNTRKSVKTKSILDRAYKFLYTLCISGVYLCFGFIGEEAKGFMLSDQFLRVSISLH